MQPPNAPALRPRTRRAWVERTRVAALAQRILDVDRTILRFGGRSLLTAEEATTLLGLADRLGVER
jgi:hypothetical protein